MTTPKTPNPPRKSRVNGFQTTNYPLASSKSLQWGPTVAAVVTAQLLHLIAPIPMWVLVCHPHPGPTNHQSFSTPTWTMAGVL